MMPILNVGLKTLLPFTGKEKKQMDFLYFVLTYYSSFIPVFNGSDTFYQVPVMNTLSSNLVELALRVKKKKNHLKLHKLLLNYSNRWIRRD